MRGWTDVDVLLTELITRGAISVGALAKARELSPTPLGLLIVRGDLQGGEVIALASELNLEVDVGAQVAAVPAEAADGAGFEPAPEAGPPIELDAPADGPLRPFAARDHLLPLALLHLSSARLHCGGVVVIGETPEGWRARYPIVGGSFEGTAFSSDATGGTLRMVLRDGVGRAEGDVVLTNGELVFDGVARGTPGSAIQLRAVARLHGEVQAPGLWLAVGELSAGALRLDLYSLD